jgi:hypothetical protein
MLGLSCSLGVGLLSSPDTYPTTSDIFSAFAQHLAEASAEIGGG